MEELISEYYCRLYDKDAIKQWNLPQEMHDQLMLEKFDYFFLTSTKESEHGPKHIHFSIFPSKFDMVYLIDVELASLEPNLLANILMILNEKGYDILTSTGFSKNKKISHYGVYFSVPKEINKEELKTAIRTLEDVKDIKIFAYSCEGCIET